MLSSICGISAEEVFNVAKFAHCVLCTVALIGKDWIDRAITWYISTKISQVLEEHRLESLIFLLRGDASNIVIMI